MTTDTLEKIDLTEFKKVLILHDKKCAMLWNKVMNENLDIDETNKIFDEMDASAILVGTEFYRATKDRNNLNNCLIGCGRNRNCKDSRFSFDGPGMIPSFYREMAQKY